MGRAGKWRAAVAVVEEEMGDVTRPDLVCMNVLLHALAKVGRKGRGQRAAGLRPGKRAAELKQAGRQALMVVLVLVQAGRWREAVQVLRQLGSRWGLRPDRVSYNTAIHACASHGRQVSQPGRQSGRQGWLKERGDEEEEGLMSVVWWLATSRRRRTSWWRRWRPPTASRQTWYVRATCCCSCLSPLSILAGWLTALCLSGGACLQVTFGALLAGCRRVGQWEEAVRLLARMQAPPYGLTPQVPHYR